MKSLSKLLQDRQRVREEEKQELLREEREKVSQKLNSDIQYLCRLFGESFVQALAGEAPLRYSRDLNGTVDTSKIEFMYNRHIWSISWNRSTFTIIFKYCKQDFNYTNTKQQDLVNIFLDKMNQMQATQSYLESKQQRLLDKMNQMQATQSYLESIQQRLRMRQD